MKLPFTSEQFLEVFRDYNQAVWPVQIIFWLLAVAAVLFVLKLSESFSLIVSLFLGVLWIWMGVVYHILFFSEINKAAYFFGAFFVVEGGLIIFAAMKKKLLFTIKWDLYGTAGFILVLFALIIYPAAGYLAGHVYPSSPTFGLPCPTTILTFGFFLWSINSLPGYLLIIPFAWSIIGASAAFTLGIIEDAGLLIASIVTLILFIIYKRKRARLA